MTRHEHDQVYGPEDGRRDRDLGGTPRQHLHRSVHPQDAQDRHARRGAMDHAPGEQRDIRRLSHRRDAHGHVPISSLAVPPLLRAHRPSIHLARGESGDISLRRIREVSELRSPSWSRCRCGPSYGPSDFQRHRGGSHRPCIRPEETGLAYGHGDRRDDGPSWVHRWRGARRNLVWPEGASSERFAAGERRSRARDRYVSLKPASSPTLILRNRGDGSGGMSDEILETTAANGAGTEADSAIPRSGTNEGTPTRSAKKGSNSGDHQVRQELSNMRDDEQDSREM